MIKTMSPDSWEQSASGLSLPPGQSAHELETTVPSIRPYLADVFVSDKLVTSEFPRPLPVDATYVVSAHTKHSSELDSTASVAYKSEFVMEDDSRYTSILAVPRKKTTEVPVVFTTALGTYIDDQYNLDLMAEYLDLGIPVLGIGPEENTSIEQTLTAQHMHEMFAHMAKFGMFDPEHVLIAGDSRGAMIGQLFAAYAEMYDVEVIGGCVVDPCLARQIQYTNPKEVLRYLPYLTVEGYSFGRQIQRIGFKKGLEHIRRLRISPGITFRTGLPLLSGDAGEFARYMREEQRLKSMLFLASVVNQHDEWEAIYANFPNIEYELIKGSHLSLLRPDVWAARKKHMAEERDNYALAA
jgi:hypothetical protein